MSNTLIKYTLTFFIAVTLFSSCNFKRSPTYYTFSGVSQATTYHIEALTDKPAALKSGIDSIFSKVNLLFSNYSDQSELYKINHSDKLIIPISNWMEFMLKQSFELSSQCNGYFDPTIRPLLMHWEKYKSMTDTDLDSIKKIIGNDKIRINNGELFKFSPYQQLDFDAIVPGFTVDAVGDYFYKKGVRNYLIELGGEVVARGKNSDGNYWKIGINKPDTSKNNNQSIQKVIELKDMALATSGNYRKWEKDAKGRLIGHIVNPKTGQAFQTDVLSATVVSQDCITADAIATALVCMGCEAAKTFIESQENIHSYLICSDTVMGFSEWASDEIISSK